MKKILLNLALVLLIFASSNIKASAYYFATDIETQVLSLDDEKCELIVLSHDDDKEEEVFPIGTILRGKFFEYKFKRRLMRDEYVKLHFYEAKLPDGTVQKIDNDLKVKPRVLVSSKHNIQLVGAAIGTALKVTIAVWSVGFPVGRGVKAITDAAYGVYNTPIKESRWKQGTKGFIKGALFPLPELLLKGEEIALHDESYLWIQDAKEDEKKLTAFVVKRKNIYLTRGKYYDEKGIEGPDFVQYLNDKDMRKYQEKLAKKGVKAEIKDKVKKKEKVIEVKENLVNKPKRTGRRASKTAESKEEFENQFAKAARIKEQALTIKPHTHIWQRSWRKPKVTFERAQ